MNSLFEDAEIISRYTRRQAIEDGVLVDLSDGETAALVKEAGFKFPIAMTAAAFNDTVAPIDGTPLPAGQDIKGRLWDVLMVLRFAIRVSKEPDRIFFKVRVFDGKRHRDVKLWAHCGPGDEMEPVITIMLQGED